MKLVEFNGHTIKPDKHAKFLGIIISDDLSGDQYIMHDEEKSLLSYLNRKLGALKQRGTLMMENLTHDETRIGHNRLKLVGIKNFMDG